MQHFIVVILYALIVATSSLYNSMMEIGRLVCSLDNRTGIEKASSPCTMTYMWWATFLGGKIP